MAHSRASLARRITLQHLTVFEAVAQAGSILAASRTLSVTQPAVSKSIHELERRLGQPLFVRGKHGVSPTDFGRLFERHARSMLADLNALAEDVNDWQSGRSGHVAVGTLISASAWLLPQAIARLRESAPEVTVSVQVGANAVLFPALARGELDLVVGLLPAAADARGVPALAAPLAHLPLYDETLCIVVGSGHPLARRRRLRLAELHGHDWIVPTPDSPARQSVRRLFQREGLGEPKRLVESVSILTNLGLLMQGSTVAMMPQSAAAPFVDAGLLRVLPLGAMPAFGQVGCSVRTDRAGTPAAQHLQAALREAAARYSASL
jgi:DNA-binding transcriptional LysR family regulator